MYCALLHEYSNHFEIVSYFQELKLAENLRLSNAVQSSSEL